MFVRLLLLFTVVPIVELLLLIELGRHIGLAPTLAIVLGTGVLGAALARWQGLATLRQVQTEMDAGRLPTGPLVDGLLILVAGAVLLTPGLLTDLAGVAWCGAPCRVPSARGCDTTATSCWTPSGSAKTVPGSTADRHEERPGREARAVFSVVRYRGLRSSSGRRASCATVSAGSRSRRRRGRDR